jgi:hypothetical protein
MSRDNALRSQMDSSRPQAVPMTEAPTLAKPGDGAHALGQEQSQVPLVRTDNLESVQTLNSPKVLESLARVEAFTRQIFTGEFTYEEREDYEIAGDRHFTFRVVDSGDLDAILARHHEWHERLREVPVSLRRLFRLSIDAR